MTEPGSSLEELMMQLHGLREENNSLKESCEKALSGNALVDNSLVGFLRSGTGGEIYYVNDAIVRMLEFDSREELIQQGAWIRYKFPEQRKEFLVMLKRDGLVNGFEASVLTKNGHERVFLFSLILKGEVIEGTLIDITERNLIQADLVKSKMELSILMNNIPGIVYSCLLDHDWTMKFVSNGSVDLTGYLPDELLEKKAVSFNDIIHPADQDRVWSTINECIALKIPFNLEYRIITKSGAVKYVWERGQALFNTDGLPDHLEGFITDITSRQQTEESLKESRLLLKASLESQKDTILFSIDKEYKYLYFNKAHQEAMKYAYQKDVAIGMNILDCITSEEDRIVAKENYNRSFAGETHSNIRIYGDIHLDYYESYFNPILNDENEVIGATGLARNISQRIEKEQQIKIQNEELQNLNATKDKFFSIISHDLRSPFNAFLGLTQIMVDDLPHLTIGELQKMAASMSSSATNLYRLLENLLQWSQIQKDAMPFNPETIYLEGIIKESIERIQETAENKGITIVMDKSGGLTVFADNHMLQSVIRNLVTNAVKYTAAGGTVTISAKKGPDGFAEISVQDTGIGMSKIMADNLFKVDLQIKRKGTAGEPSTGLGLVLCKEFVERQGGTIRVESEEGKGSVFYFTIPLPA